MDRLGIEVLCVFGMPPVAFVEFAADLGCRHISLGLEPMPENYFVSAPRAACSRS